MRAQLKKRVLDKLTAIQKLADEMDDEANETGVSDDIWSDIHCMKNEIDEYATAIRGKVKL